MNKENTIFTIVFGIICCSVFALWFFNHSASPYFAKTEYSFGFSELGTLAPGAKVRVGGLHLGQVTEVSLTPEIAIAKADIAAEVEIPKDSKVRIINVGLVGERVLNIDLGDSDEIYKDSEIIYGAYDLGSVGIVVSATKAIDELTEIFEKVGSVFDSTLVHPKTKKTWTRITQKAVKLSKTISRIQKGTEADVNLLFVDLRELNQAIDAFSKELDPEIQQLQANSKDLNNSGEALSSGLMDLREQFLGLKANIQTQKQSMVYHLMEETEFQILLDSTLSSWRGLQQQLLNRTHTLNVDIF